MATANFYTFAKRKNSTKQPTGTGTQLTVNLKSGTSLISPTFLLSLSSRPDYNYLSFEGRYYFITDIISVRDSLWEIQASVDALGTWKTTISSAEAMILYATGGSLDIIDQRLNLTDAITIGDNTAVFTNLLIVDNIWGAVILSITGEGSFGCYLMQAPNMMYQLMENIDAWGQNTMSDELEALKQLVFGGSAPNNLKGAIALPFVLSATGQGSIEQLYLGKYPCTDSNGNPINGYPINTPIVTDFVDVVIPWQYADWRRYAPYTKVYLYIPFIGMVAIPSSEVVNEYSLRVFMSLNITSGDLAVEVRGLTSGRLLSTASTNCAMSIPFGSANISGAKLASAVGVGLATAAGILTSGASTAATALSAGAGMTATAAGLINALGGESSGGGGLGGGASQGLDKAVHCYTVSRTLADSQANVNPIIGRPVMAKKTIGTYSGYVQTDGLSISGNMTDTEREAINSAFNGGAYFE